MTAGTVAVDVLDSRDDTTRLRVTYDLTALTVAGEAWLAAFDDRVRHRDRVVGHRD